MAERVGDFRRAQAERSTKALTPDEQRFKDVDKRADDVLELYLSDNIVMAQVTALSPEFDDVTDLEPLAAILLTESTDDEIIARRVAAAQRWNELRSRE